MNKNKNLIACALLITPDTNLIETLYDMGHVYPGSAILVNLMEHIISEQFDHVAIPRLGPLRIKIKPVTQNVKCKALIKIW